MLMNWEPHRWTLSYSATTNFRSFSETTCSSNDTVPYEHSMPVESASYFVGDHMLLQCIEGFTNIGTKQQFCSESGRWSIARPHCVGKLCFDVFTLVWYDALLAFSWQRGREEKAVIFATNFDRMMWVQFAT